MTNEKADQLRGDVKKLKARVKDLESLIKVSAIINSTLDLDKLVGLVMETAQKVMRAEASSVMLINKETNRLDCKIALGVVKEQVVRTLHLDKGQGVAGWVWEHEKPLIVQDVTKDSRFYGKMDRQSGFKTRSILAAPLIVKGRILGVAEVINRTDKIQFTQDDLELFNTFCSNVALAIENARVHQLALEQERIQQQLDSAKIIQQSFMPTIKPTTTRQNYELSARNLQAISVGGDFYDAVELGGERLGLLIGDVAGKGIPAALFMARLMSDFRFIAHNENEPGKVLCRLNDILVERSTEGIFVTLFYMVIDLNSGNLKLANGGHLPAIYVPENGRPVRTLNSKTGIPIGIIKGTAFDTVAFSIKPGDFILLITDGVTESRNKSNRMFGMKRFKRVVSQQHESTELMIDRIEHDVKEFSKYVPQQDDITALAFRWKGPRR